MPLSTIEEAIAEIRRGRMVILMDDKDRENEGDLCMAAEKATPAAINFMATHGRGLICLPLTEERVKRLGVSMMVSENTSPFGTAFTVSIDAATGITTGISAADRAKTILDAIADDAKSQDLVTPGHIFPLRARNRGSSSYEICAWRRFRLRAPQHRRRDSTVHGDYCQRGQRRGPLSPT